ncbi:MAG: trans-sulfuration enzyme family protein, partial [Acidobacteriota bacterium]
LALERCLCALEGGAAASAFASGMAAIMAVMVLLKAGDHIISSDNLYGGTYRLFSSILKRFGLEFSYVDTTSVDRIRKAIRPSTRMVYVETPTNPMMAITDLGGVAALCREKNLISVCDNTFMSPYLQRPLAHGIDIVLHSTTKFINGHSDSVGGVVICGDREQGERIAFTQNSAGAILSPFDSFLVMRGVKTLALRMEAHDSNGRRLAEHLAGHPKVKKVFYPGLPSHPGHDLARRQMNGFGAMISFDLGSVENARCFLNHIHVMTLAESLGGVETLVCHPASMTHASVPPAERQRIGLGDGLVRISAGVEDIEDLLADLNRGLAPVV